MFPVIFRVRSTMDRDSSLFYKACEVILEQVALDNVVSFSKLLLSLNNDIITENQHILLQCGI